MSGVFKETNSPFTLPPGQAPKELHLKDRSEQELHDSLFESGSSWNEKEVKMVEDAYQLVKGLFRDDEYKGQPYIYHLLRCANRVAGYLELPEPELIIASLLHDVVEDHPKELLVHEWGSIPWDLDLDGLQGYGFKALEKRYTSRVAEGVASVTNPPDLSKKNYPIEEFLFLYAEKVERAVETPDGWVLKFVDWCDNGLGMAFSDLNEEQNELLKDKYGRAMVHLEKRYRKGEDIRSMLSSRAREYVESQFALGHERLKFQRRMIW